MDESNTRERGRADGSTKSAHGDAAAHLGQIRAGFPDRETLLSLGG